MITYKIQKREKAKTHHLIHTAQRLAQLRYAYQVRILDKNALTGTEVVDLYQQRLVIEKTARGKLSTLENIVLWFFSGEQNSSNLVQNSQDISYLLKYDDEHLHTTVENSKCQ